MSKSIIPETKPQSNPPPITFEQVRASARKAGLFIARELDPGVAEIPSATLAGLVYTTTLISATQASCSCGHPARCWHVRRARQLTKPLVAAPAPRPLRTPAEIEARYRSAMADLYGDAA